MSCWSKDKRIDQWNKQRAYKKATDVEVLGSWERTGGDGKRTVFLIIMIMEKLGIHTGKKMQLDYYLIPYTKLIIVKV